MCGTRRRQGEVTRRQPEGRLQRGDPASVEDSQRSREHAFTVGRPPDEGHPGTGTSCSHRAAEAESVPSPGFTEKLRPQASREKGQPATRVGECWPWALRRTAQTPRPHPWLAALATAGLPGLRRMGAALNGVGSRISQETWNRGWTHVRDLVTGGRSTVCHTDQQGSGDRHSRAQRGHLPLYPQGNSFT